MVSATTAIALPEVPHQGRKTTLLSAIALTSFSALLLELGLTRLFSVVLFYHFAFLSISIALLGLGAGGVFAYIWKPSLAKWETRALASNLCLLNALLIAGALEVVVHVPVSLALSWSNFGNLTAIYLCSAAPFFVTGLVFSMVFARETHAITRLYGADLGGGAVACLALVPLLDWIGGPNTILFSGFTMLIAAALWAPRSDSKKRALLWAAVMATIIGLNYYGTIVDVIYAKGLRRDRSTGVEYMKWNAISRVEVDLHPNGARNIVIDADAGTAIMNVDPRHWTDIGWARALMSTAPSIPNVLRPHGSYAIIGPGGGVDVLRAVGNGSPSVTGIEINPIIVNNIMRGRYANYSYHLYEIPEVHVHVSDGRSFVRSTPDHYDVLQMTLVDTWASTAAGAFALSENNLYTVEAFREYFEHLKSDGMIAITRWEFKQPREALRVVSVAMEALHRLGVSDPSSHFIIVSESALDLDGIPVLVLAKKTPFTPDEETAVQQHLAQHPNLVPMYLPSHRGSSPFSNLIASNDPRTFAKDYPYNVAPVTDNTPFFFFTLKPEQILGEAGLQKGIDWKVNLGVVVLAMVLVISLLAVILFLILPLILRGASKQRPFPLLYFVAIGMGYILVEIAFIQRFVLFLGHPTYALTVVIFLLLVASGAGSLASRRWLTRTAQGWLPIALVIGGILLYVFVLPGMLSSMVGYAFTLKLAISAVILVPLGFGMGMPFPTGLRALASVQVPEFPTSAPERNGPSNGNAVEWAWALNAAASVLGSVMAMIIAIQFGLNVTLACGAAAYLVALPLARTLEPSHA
jgi:hypothetical protein